MGTCDLTVILPCAGEGKRLGMKIPKELYLLAPGIRLIDFTLEHLRRYYRQWEGKRSILVCLVIRRGKESVFHYAAERLAPIDTRAVEFDSRLREWPGSVYSAAAAFSSRNMVLLPDTVVQTGPEGYFTDARGRTLVEKMKESLGEGPVSFGWKSEGNRRKLENRGALRVRGERITAFQDKPRESLSRYNAFWGCYGFRRETAGELHAFLHRSVQHDSPDYRECSFFPSAGFPLHGYHDLGTWRAIHGFRKQCAGFLEDFGRDPSAVQ